MVGRFATLEFANGVSHEPQAGVAKNSGSVAGIRLVVREEGEVAQVRLPGDGGHVEVVKQIPHLTFELVVGRLWRERAVDDAV